MNYFRFPLLVLLIIGLIGPTALVSAVGPVQGSTALERGYRTGYSDGYMAGYRDKQFTFNGHFHRFRLPG